MKKLILALGACAVVALVVIVAVVSLPLNDKVGGKEEMVSLSDITYTEDEWRLPPFSDQPGTPYRVDMTVHNKYTDAKLSLNDVQVKASNGKMYSCAYTWTGGERTILPNDEGDCYARFVLADGAVPVEVYYHYTKSGVGTVIEPSTKGVVVGQIQT